MFRFVELVVNTFLTLSIYSYSSSDHGHCYSRLGPRSSFCPSAKLSTTALKLRREIPINLVPSIFGAKHPIRLLCNCPCPLSLSFWPRLRSKTFEICKIASEYPAELWVNSMSSKCSFLCCFRRLPCTGESESRSVQRETQCGNRTPMTPHSTSLLPLLLPRSK